VVCTGYCYLLWRHCEYYYDHYDILLATAIILPLNSIPFLVAYSIREYRVYCSYMYMSLAVIVIVIPIVIVIVIAVIAVNSK
jgi:heme/copper-type cytochrome/quinol oxidase subunit 2